MVWSQHYGDEFGEYPTAITESGDGGSIIVGSITQIEGGDFNIFIMKVDEDGDSVWFSIYGEQGDQRAHDVAGTPDGGFLVVGSTETASGEHALVLKFDSDGAFIWQKLISGELWEMYRYHRILPIPNEGYYLIGVAIRIIQGDFYMNTDCLVSKFSLEGNLIWTRVLGDPDMEEYCYDAIITSDGGLALTGYWWNIDFENYPEAMLMKISPDIEIEWTKHYDNEEGIEIMFSLMQDSNNGFALVGLQSLDLPTEYIVTTDEDGELNWTKTFGGEGVISYARWIGDDNENGLLMAGYSNAEGSGNYDFHLVALDTDGNRKWSRAYGGVEADQCMDVFPTGDGGFLLVGETSNFGTPNPLIPDVWLIKIIDPDGVAGEPVEESPSDLSLWPAYPNPFNSTAILSFQTPSTGAVYASLVDESGREWRRWTTSPMSSGTGRFVLDGAGLPAGVYWVKVSQGGQSVQQRVVLVK